MNVGITTTAATSHGFAAAEALAGERAASVIFQDQPSSGIDQLLVRKAYRLADTCRHRARSAACSSRHTALRRAVEQGVFVRVVSFEVNADRQPLHHFDKITCGILRRQQG